MTPEQKKWIDEASYYQLLDRWRNTPAGGDAIFQGEAGKYYSQVMAKRKVEVGPAMHVSTSKAIG